MKKDTLWHALFSQSGSEIYEISKQIGRFPDAIITNKPVEKLELINPKLLEEAFERFVFLPRIPTPLEYNTALCSGALVTLHGYLRILPPEVCFRYNTYNGHPGLITKYPELKGKDPQKKSWDNNAYLYHGHVIHKVISAVDEGQIESAAYFKCSNIKEEFIELENYIEQLHKVSINNWVAFMKKKIKIGTIYHG